MILGILQARVSSTRFPGKVLKQILGEAMLVRQMERLGQVKKIDKIVIATSTEPADDPLVELCEQKGFHYFRGSLHNVLERFSQAADLYQPHHVVRLTGDCPLCDPSLIDQVITCHLQGNYDYTSNTIEPSFPDGLDVEVMTYSALMEANREAVLPSDREHVTRFLYTQPARYRLGQVKNAVNLAGLRWTVDESIDFELISQIYQALYPLNRRFTSEDILRYLDAKPELKKLNTHYERNEGMVKSLAADQKFIKENARDETTS